MKTKKVKKAAIVAMSVAAMQAAVADMKAEFGDNYIPMDGHALIVELNPFDGGLIA
jgi:hypothetical protein